MIAGGDAMAGPVRMLPNRLQHRQMPAAATGTGSIRTSGTRACRPWRTNAGGPPFQSCRGARAEPRRPRGPQGPPHPAPRRGDPHARRAGPHSATVTIRRMRVKLLYRLDWLGTHGAARSSGFPGDRHPLGSCCARDAWGAQCMLSALAQADPHAPRLDIPRPAARRRTGAGGTAAFHRHRVQRPRPMCLSIRRPGAAGPHREVALSGV